MKSASVTQTHARNRRAFTLVELLAVIVIMSTIASVASGVIYSAAEAYAKAQAQRNDIQSANLALDRIVRILRETPSVSGQQGVPDIIRAETAAIGFGDGVVIELTGDVLTLATATEAPSPLARGVTLLLFEYLSKDGVTDTMATPQSTKRINITIRVGQLELRTSVTLRTTLGAL